MMNSLSQVLVFRMVCLFFWQRMDETWRKNEVLSYNVIFLVIEVHPLDNGHPFTCVKGDRRIP